MVGLLYSFHLINKTWTTRTTFFGDNTQFIIALLFKWNKDCIFLFPRYCNSETIIPKFQEFFTHYESYLDQKHKKSLIETLLFHWFLIFSYYTLLHLEIENLRETFKKNSYPSGFLEQSIKSFLNKIHVLKKVIPTMSKKELFVMTSRNDVINLGLKLRTCFKNSLPQCNIKIIFKSTNRLSSLFHFKDVIPNELQSHIAYRFSCGNCDVTYNERPSPNLT